MSVTTAIKKERRSLLGDSPIIPPTMTLVAACIIFSVFVPNFRTMRTASGIVGAASINSVIVIGVTLLMIAGEFDLSVGSVMAVGGFVFAKNVMYGGSPLVAVALALSVGAVMGFINGWITVGTGIPSFIVTLGTRSIYRGAAWVYSGGLMVQTTQELPVYDFLNGRLDVVNDLVHGANFRTAFLWAIVLGVVVQFLLTRSRFGNQVFATGGNQQAAVAQGVDVKLVKLLCFTMTGALAAFAGVLTFSQFKTIFVASGTGFELTAIASAVVGGTVLSGGVGSILGGLLGILLINVLRSGVILLGLPSDNFPAIVGVTIVAASILNERIRRRL